LCLQCDITGQYVIDMESSICASVMRACVKAKRGHFEHILMNYFQPLLVFMLIFIATVIHFYERVDFGVSHLEGAM